PCALEFPVVVHLAILTAGGATLDDAAIVARLIRRGRRGIWRNDATEFVLSQSTVSVRIALVEALTRPVPFRNRKAAIAVHVQAREEIGRRLGADRLGGSHVSVAIPVQRVEQRRRAVPFCA